MSGREPKGQGILVDLLSWALNIGLAGMILITLQPVGFLQLQKAYTDGFWAARQFTFY